MIIHKAVHILLQFAPKTDAKYCDICGGDVRFRPIGLIAEQEIGQLPARFNIEIPKHVVMPNHVHLIIIIERAGQSPAPTISNVIGAFKSIATKKANKYDGMVGRQIWQRSYYDHIIRDGRDYKKIWEYIDANPLKWKQDCFYEE